MRIREDDSVSNGGKDSGIAVLHESKWMTEDERKEGDGKKTTLESIV